MSILNAVIRISALLSASLSLAAGAHITLETRQAEAGSYYKAVFRVGHGCDGSPIKEILVRIPSGVQGAKPMPKAGWQLVVDKQPLDQPYNSHGKTVREDTASVRWSGGPLPDAFYDEFIISAKLPERSGKLYWQVTQICEQGRIDWIETPAEGHSLSEYKTPAALLELTPKADPSAHQH